MRLSITIVTILLASIIVSCGGKVPNTEIDDVEQIPKTREDAGAKELLHPEDVDEFKSLKNNPRKSEPKTVKYGGDSTTPPWQLRQDIKRLEKIEDKEKASINKMQGTGDPHASKTDSDPEARLPKEFIGQWSAISKACAR